MQIESLGTYLPPWEEGGRRVPGLDEDAVTMAVAAGRAALAGVGDREVRSVVFVSRTHPLLEGGSAAVLLAGLGLPAECEVTERLGGAPATLDALLGAGPGTLIVAADAGTQSGAGAAAAVTGTRGIGLTDDRRVQRSLPTQVRTDTAGRVDYDDPRLERDRGWQASVNLIAGSQVAGSQVAGPKPVGSEFVAVAGLTDKDERAVTQGALTPTPTRGASSVLFALVAAAEAGVEGPVLAAEQATVTVATLHPGPVAVQRREPEPVVTRLDPSPGADLKLSLPAYDRAFAPKLRFESGRCPSCGSLSYPPRRLCPECGEEAEPEVVALPRTGVVYTSTTVHVPVPGLRTPYAVVIVELDEVGVRVLAPVSGPARGDSIPINAPGTLEFRRLATRAGVPDYGYGFVPERGT